jgi:hypothetical protein
LSIVADKAALGGVGRHYSNGNAFYSFLGGSFYLVRFPLNLLL